jgi:hypothetical protein
MRTDTRVRGARSALGETSRVSKVLSATRHICRSARWNRLLLPRSEPRENVTV